MLEFSITTLRYPGEAVQRLTKLSQYTDGSVGDPLCDQHDAQVTISIYDEACKHVRPLDRRLYVTWHKIPIFWGIITNPVWNLAEGTVTINALDDGFRMTKHYLRLGDDALNGFTTDGTADPAKGIIRTQTDGYNSLLQAAYNTAGQTARGVPDLGIKYADVPDSEDPLAPEYNHEVSRGDECWATMVSLSSQQAGYEFTLEPFPWDTTEEYYSQLVLAERLGTDRSDSVVWHFGWGKDNLETFTPTPQGTAVITHDHVLSQDLKHRGTAAALEPSARQGVYVKWDALPVNVSSPTMEPEEVLADFGMKTVLDYGEPPVFMDMTLRAETEDLTELIYQQDFFVGDIVKVVAKKGFYAFSGLVRITKVTVKQESGQARSRQELSVIPVVYHDVDLNGEQ